LIVNVTICTLFTLNDNWVLCFFAHVFFSQSRSIEKGPSCWLEAFLPGFVVHVPIEHWGLPAVHHFLKWTTFPVTATRQSFSFCCIKCMVPGKNEICITFKYLTGLVDIMFYYITTILNNEIVCRQSMEIFSGLYCSCTHWAIGLLFPYKGYI